MSTTKTPLTNLDLFELSHLFESWGEPAFRARQVWEWVYRKLADSTDTMTNLPKTLRQVLDNNVQLSSISLIKTWISNDRRAEKHLFRLQDGKTIESVSMFYGHTPSQPRISVCVSTQVGCPIGCPFCATGLQGFERNLEAGEMVEQVLHSARIARQDFMRQPPFIDNIVFMGMGEPLLNYKNLWKAIAILNSPYGLGIGARNITISTSGIVPMIKQMANEPLQVGLAVSLHAPDNTLRDRLVPVNRKYPIEKLIDACRYYIERTGRRITFEYILFQDINDSVRTATMLSRLIAGLNCHINLICANTTSSKVFRKPSFKQVQKFTQELRRHGINVTLRERLGNDIEAGCGQLRSRYLRDEQLLIQQQSTQL